MVICLTAAHFRSTIGGTTSQATPVYTKTGSEPDVTFATGYLTVDHTSRIFDPSPSPSIILTEPHAESPAESIAKTDINVETVNDSESLPDPPPVRLHSHRRYLTIATMFRNKRQWLREWIEFYLMMGAEHFLLYDNNSTDLSIEILQHYIDRGVVTYITWPPTQVPAPTAFQTRLEESQYAYIKSYLELCLANNEEKHKQVPCQRAAFTDAIRRTKGGESRWIGIVDVDEYIYPRATSNFTSIVGLLEHRHANDDSVNLFGNTFGSSGFVDHAVRRQPGDALHPLVTESYIYRAPSPSGGKSLI